MIGIDLARLSHIDLEVACLAFPGLNWLALPRRPAVRPMSAPNRPDGIERRR
jgi:hypothetical protein